MKKNILVTGAFGFVGQWLVKRLLERGDNVIVISHENKTPLHNWTLDDVYFESGDIRNYDFIKKIFNKYDLDIVFHLAAQALVEEALKNPFETMQTNIMGTVNLLECARKYNGLEKIVVASSDKAYGNEKSPYDESTPLNGRFPYDCSKSCTDLVSQSYRDSYKLPISIVRCGNIFGGGDLNWNRVFPEAIKSCYEKRPMEIRSDGVSMLRDYIYVEDVVDAYIFISDLKQNETVNVSYGKTKNVIDILRLIQNTTQFFTEPNIQNTARCEIDIQCLNGDRIRSLGWFPKYYSENDRGMEAVLNTAEWYYNYFDKEKLH